MINKILPVLLMLTATLLAAPVPSATGTAPEKQMMGEAFSIDDICFSNTGDATGYAPRYEMVTPKGVIFKSASFNGGTKSQQVLSCAIDSPTECNATNPDTGKNITLQPGEALWIVSYPLGSFPTDMPKQCMTFNFRLGNTPDVTLNVPENIEVTPYFALGDTAEDDGNFIYPNPDEPLKLEVIPVVFKITKTFNAHEGETVTGRHFAKTFTLGLNIARDENVTNVVVEDDLPAQLQYISPIDNLPAGCSIDSEPDSSTPGGTLAFTCTNLRGTSSDDVVEHNITVHFFVPDVLSDCTGTVLNKVTANYDYTDLDTNSTYTYSDDANDTIRIKAMAVQKSVELFTDNGVPGISPDDILKYTIQMQLSDYFDANNTIFRDVLDDTQTAVDLNNSTWSIDSSAITANGTFTEGASVTTSIAGNGAQNVDFNLSAASGVDLVGGEGTSKGTKVTLTFFAKIDKTYRSSGEAIRAGDYIQNNISIDTDAHSGCDTSSSETEIAIAKGNKTVYAINGNVVEGSEPYLVKSDDNVTYKLTVNFPISSYQNVTLSDYLPSPIFNTNGFTNGEAPVWDGNNTTHIPLSGDWSTGPDNTTDVNGLGVTLSVDTAQNKLSWKYTLDDADTNVTKASKLVLLFTVKATDAPLADQLVLANLGILDYNGTKEPFSGSDIVPIVTLQPVLSIDKNITATSNHRGQTLPAKTLAQVDAGDVITYRIGISNTGHAAAFDVNITDTLNRPALENCIRIFSTDDSQVEGSGLDSFIIKYIDRNSTFYVDYNCTVTQDANPGTNIINEANITAYSNIPGGQDFLANKEPLTSKATLQMYEDTALTKTLYDTSLPSTPGSNLNPGEIAYFEINATLGEGTYVNFSITDAICDNTPFLYDNSANVTFSGNDVIVTATQTNSHGTLTYRCEHQTKALDKGSYSNTAVMDADNITQKSANAPWTVTQPNPNPTKTMDPPEADAGDTISVTMNWDSNNTDNPSYRCTVTDKLDDRFDFGTITTPVAPPGYSCSADTTNGIVTCTSVDANKTCGAGPATFDVNLKADILVGGSLDNIIEFNGHALPQDHNNSDAADYDYKTDDNDTTVLKLRSPLKPIKVFTKTSEDFTNPGDTKLSAIPDVAVGEIVDVNITYAFFEGTTKTVSLQDIFLTKGLAYVPGSMKISRSSDKLETENTDINNSLGGIAVGTPVSVDESNITQDENHLSIDLGNVYNLTAQDGVHKESFTLSFKVKVKNSINVNAGTYIQDQGRTLFHDSVTDNLRQADSDIREMNVVEPKPTLRKVADKVTVEGGTVVNYTMYACNDESNTSIGTTTGYDWNLTDTLPAHLDIVSGSVTAIPSVPISELSSKEFNASIDNLAPGECVVFTYQSKVADDVPFGEVMTNSATLTATSLPEAYGTAGDTNLTEDGPGEINGERTGSRIGSNDLYVEADASIVAKKAGIAKRLVSPDKYYAIGEKASYRIRMGLVKGTAQNFVVHDELPKGLVIDVNSIRYSHTGTVNPVEPTDMNITGNASTGQTITFNYGELNATALSGLGIDYNVTVINTLDNQDGTMLVNKAFVTFDDPLDSTQSIKVDQVNPTKPIKVGEPNLFLQKRVTSSLTGLQAGSVMQWEVNIQNNGHTLAHDVNWTDTLPAGLSSATPVFVALSGAPAVLSGTTTRLDNTNLHGNGTSLYLDTFDLSADSSVKITFEATLENSVVAGDTLENVTHANYNSIPDAIGTVDGIDGRNSLDCGDDDDDAVLNNYCESAKAAFTIAADLDIDKHLVGNRDAFTIGEALSYNLRVSFVNGVTKNVVIQDALPDGLKYVSATCSDPGGTAIIFDCDVTSTDPVTISLGDISNPDDSNQSNNYIDINLRVLVENIKANQNGVTLVNGDTAGTKVFVTSDTNTSAETVPVEIKVIEPDIIVTKSAAPATQARGDIVDYTITLQHSSRSTSDAYNIEFTDVLDDDLHYIPGSSDVNGSQSGQILTFDIAHFALGETKTIHYQARIDANATPDSNLTNQLATTFRSIPDANGSIDGGRNGNDGTGPDEDSVLNNYMVETSATVLVNSNKLKPTKSMRFEKDSNNDGLVNAGDFLKYRLNVVNELNTSVNDINISDHIDQSLTLLLDSIQVYQNHNLLVDTGASNANWTLSGDYWYHYAESNITIDYFGDTNYFEIYWNGIFASSDEFDVLYDTKINDGNITEVVFVDGTTLDINRSQNTRVAAGTVIDNIFTVDSNNTEPSDSNKVTIVTKERGRALLPLKEITDTNQSFTNGLNVAVGEVIDVKLTFGFSSGITDDVMLSEYYTKGNFVYIPDSMELERSSDKITVSQTDLNSSFGTGTTKITVDDSIVNFRPDGFDLNISNVTVDANRTEETLYLTFKLRVDNNESVQNANTLPDHGAVTYLEYDPVTSSSSIVEYNTSEVSVTVVEPLVEVKKDVNISTASVADDLQYTLKICNRGSTNGYEWNILDTLPDTLEPSGFTFDDNGTSANIIDGGLSGQELNVTIDVLKPTECVNILLNVTVTSLAEFKETILNEVNVTTTSLPGIFVYERTGVDGYGGLNDLYDEDNTTVTIGAPNLAKEITGKKQYYAIGELVKHTITAGLPASTNLLKFKDIFPSGLVYIAKSVVLQLPTGASVSYPDIANRETLLSAENAVAFDLGELNITTPGDMNISVTSRVQNIPSVCAGTKLKNYIEMYFEDSSALGISDEYNASSGDIVIGEPNLNMTNELVGFDPLDPKTVGDTISYKVVLHNEGETMAYNVHWYDIIPQHTDNITNMVLIASPDDLNKSDGSGLLSNADFSTGDHNLTLVPFDLPSGSTITVTFDTEITSSTIDELTNTAYATTQSDSNASVARTVSEPDCQRAYDTNASVPFFINQLPIANDDCTLTIKEYRPYSGDLTYNDTLGDGTKAEHTWRLLRGPKHGTATVNKDGTFVYEPNANYNGPDSFTYELEDINGDKDQAKVCINVACASSQPSDSGDAGNVLSMLLMFILTTAIGLYYIRDEKARRQQ